MKDLQLFPPPREMGSFRFRKWLESLFLAKLNIPWTDWTPTLTGSGSMGVASPTITRARYRILRNDVDVAVEASCTVSAPLSTTLFISEPSAVSAVDSNHPLEAMIHDNGTLVEATCWHASNQINIKRFDGDTLTAGPVAVYIRGSYQITEIT